MYIYFWNQEEYFQFTTTWYLMVSLLIYSHPLIDNLDFNNIQPKK